MAKAKDKIRVYELARELNLETKELLEVCHEAGVQAKNQLTGLTLEQRETIEEFLKQGRRSKGAQAARPATPVVPLETKKPIRDLSARPRPRQDLRSRPKPTVTPEAEEPEKQAEVPAQPAPPAEKPAAAEEPQEGPKPAASAVTPTPGPVPTIRPPRDRKIRDLGAGKTDRPKPRPRPVAPPTPPVANSATPSVPPPSAPTPQPPPPKKSKEKTQAPVRKITPELLKDLKQGRITASDLVKAKKPIHTPDIEEEEEEGKGKKERRRKDRGVSDREARKRAREERAQKRKEMGYVKIDHGHVVVEDEDSTRTGTRLRARRRRRAGQPVVRPRQGKITLEPPITVRSLSEALGIKATDILRRLMMSGVGGPLNINTVLEEETAEEIAIEEGCEIEIKRPPDKEDLLLAEFEKPDDPSQLQPRAPIVTVMGHVDHGKTSLLDRIRRSNVVATEAGGITQVIRAWRVEYDGKPITFLDTPGHEAFTKMRARGAQVTDIAVIVVAADDGVMPQTEEAISHAKAAGVSLIIAINKIDVPNADVDRTRSQLYSLGILPDNMGGDTPFVETSAVTGQGIDELLENIILVAELKELKANPNKPARGVCLEAMLSEGEGVLATLLVKDGTLRRGDIVLCGVAYGRVRQMYDDLNRPIDSAGPSTPVRITGLNEIPEADDTFYVVPDLQTAREIAEKRLERRQIESQTPARPSLDLFRLADQHITELKIILKADFRGSIEAIRKEIEKLQHEEVRIKILHAAIGGITESDVQLALTSPEDTMIIGFNVVPDDRARALAEEKGITIREYNVIYMLTDDLKAALEGRLKPRQETIHLGRAVVREVFKISRVGTVAGCYVTQGVIQRNAKIRVIREGAVIYPPPDRTASLESLKRFKDDVSEVREGYECGIKIAGYDDIKVGDVIEAFRVEEIKRTLDD